MNDQSFSVIDEAAALQIADRFAGDVQVLLGGQMRAVVIVGSLGAGRYVPGRSDIDLIVIVDNACSDELKAEVRNLAERYWKEYGPRKGFGGYAIREGDFHPPFGSLHDMAFEILQLKRQGRVLLGAFDLDAIPEPTHAHMKHSLEVFVREIAGGWERTYPPPIDTDDAHVSSILYWLRFFVWDRTGNYILDKREALAAFGKLDGTTDLFEMIAPVRAYVNRDTNHPGSVSLLRRDVERFVLEHVGWASDALERCGD